MAAAKSERPAPGRLCFEDERPDAGTNPHRLNAGGLLHDSRTRLRMRFCSYVATCSYVAAVSRQSSSADAVLPVATLPSYVNASIVAVAR